MAQDPGVCLGTVTTLPWCRVSPESTPSTAVTLFGGWRLAPLFPKSRAAV